MMESMLSGLSEVNSLITVINDIGIDNIRNYFVAMGAMQVVQTVLVALTSILLLIHLVKRG